VGVLVGVRVRVAEGSGSSVDSGVPGVSEPGLVLTSIVLGVPMAAPSVRAAFMVAAPAAKEFG